MSSVRGLLVGLVVLGVGCGYRDIPRAGNAVDEGWAEVQNQYQRRADLTPSLVAVVKAYAAHETQTLEAVVAARSKATSVQIDPAHLDEASLKRFEQAQAEMGGALGRLLALSESYPQLRSADNFRDLQAQLEGTENRIAVARRRYIASVRAYNDLVTVPPSSWTASIFYHAKPKPQFTATGSQVERPPEVKL